MNIFSQGRFQVRLWVIVLLLTSLQLDSTRALTPREKLVQYERKKKEKQEVTLSKRFHIGGMMPSPDYEVFFRREIERLNFDGVSVSEYNTLYNVTATSSGNPIRDAKLICEKLIPKGVFAIVLGGRLTTATTTAASYTGGFYHIPVVGSSSRDSAFSDKNIHGSFLRTVPPFSHEADVWVELIMMFQFSQVVLIHSSDSNGRALLGRLQRHFDNLRDDIVIKLSAVVEFQQGVRNLTKKLLPIKNSPIRVILLCANEEDSDSVLRAAKHLDLFGPESVWILTERALRSEYAPEGALGLRLMQSEEHKKHISDSLRVIALSLRHLQEEKPLDIVYPPKTCKEEDLWNVTGKELFEVMEKQVIYSGNTGKIAFDQKGDRMFAEYAISNVQKCRKIFDEECRSNHMLVNIGRYFYDTGEDKMRLSINKTLISWGEGSKKEPSGIYIKRHLKVVTIEEIPFVYSDSLNSESSCKSKEESRCFLKKNNTKVEEERCCFGYCVELLNSLAETNNFTFILYLSPDGLYGERQKDMSEQHAWNGMVNEIVENRADMIVAPLTINPERARVMDFSKPFKYQGITILVKKEKDAPALVSILQPFQVNLWLMLLGTVHGIALLVWLLDRLSPMFKREGRQTDSLRISEAFWFSWGVILNSGLGEGTPRCLSARVMSMIWAGFAMIIVASYTANLAAFLVLDTGVEAISGINDAKLRNPVENFTFATVRGSAVDMFFRRKTEWSNMYRVMEANNYPSADEAIEAVRNGSLQAFIWDSSRLEYAASQDCELITAGEIFGRSGYGIGLKKNSFWSEDITQNILEFHEKGYMADLDARWIWNESQLDCPPDLSNAPQRLGLANLEGIFMMVIGGVVAGIVLIIVEILYAKYKTEHSKEAEDLKINQSTQCLNHNTELREDKKSNSRQCCPNFLKSSNKRVHPASRCPCLQCQENEMGKQQFMDLNSIRRRIETSSHVPKCYKESTPKQWLNHYIQNSNKEYCCHTVPREQSLREMLIFAEANHMDSFPDCQFRTSSEEVSDEMPVDFESSCHELHSSPMPHCSSTEEPQSSIDKDIILSDITYYDSDESHHDSGCPAASAVPEQYFGHGANRP